MLGVDPCYLIYADLYVFKLGLIKPDWRIKKVVEGFGCN